MSQEHIKKCVQSVIDGVKANPLSAEVVFRASTELNDGMRCSGKIREFPDLLIDEPAGFGGTDSGPGPADILLVALGTCQEVTYRVYASLMGIELESVHCDLRADLDLRGFLGMDLNVPSGITKIVYETKIKSSASPEALAKLAQTVEQHCPILKTLQTPVEVLGRVIINDRPLAVKAAA